MRTISFRCDVCGKETGIITGWLRNASLYLKPEDFTTPPILKWDDICPECREILINGIKETCNTIKEARMEDRD